MKPRSGSLVLLLWLALLAGFVLWTARALPPVVASHFGLSGAADGFMPRAVYIGAMLAVVVGAPLLLAWLPGAIAGKGGRLNIPHREHWLAPERRAATVAFVRAHGQWFAAALALFMAWLHWLVVQANQARPPVLSTGAMLGGLAVFFAALAVWLAVLYRRFRRP